MKRRFARFACIDWSGARGDRLPGLAVATCGAGDTAPALVPPPDGARRWSRRQLLQWLRARSGDDLLVGVDFSAALPFADRGSYFPDDARAPASARALWALVDAAGGAHLSAEGFLADPAFAAHFRIGAIAGTRFERGPRNGRLRRVEAEAASGRAASCFNLVGANQVGKASLSGMRVLHRLGGALAIWPFDPVPRRGAVLVEIYTGIAARAAARPPGRAKMRSWEALDAALAAPAIASRRIGRSGAIDDHASDALLGAAWLRRAASEHSLWRAPPAAIALAEGWTFGVPYRKDGAVPA